MKKPHVKSRKLLTLALTLALAVSFIPGAAAVNLLDSLFRLDFGPGKYSVYKVDIQSTPVIVTNTVTYHPNEGDGVIVKVTVDRGDEHALVSQGYVRDKHNFKGWNTEADGTGSAYTVGESITVTDDITLYAQWKITYTVIYLPNGGDGTIGMVTEEEGAMHRVVDYGFTRFGYMFDDYSDTYTGIGKRFCIGDLIEITEDTILYARWSRPY